MKKIAVIGGGAMGSGIGQVAAMAGHEVVIFDAYPAALEKAGISIKKSLEKLESKGKLTPEELNAITGRVQLCNQLQMIEGSNLVIEAIIEDEEAKKKIFPQIESFVDDEAIIATNTSSFSVTSLATSLKKPERCVGIHFFNPAVLMKLVEIIPALQTNEEIIEEVSSLIQSWGKQTVVAKDTPGFIVNRIARPYYGEALRIADEQLATPQLIDQIMRELGGFRMGPFELMDFIGHDVNAAVTRSFWTSMYFDARYRPSFLQEKMVKAGWLGKKAGKGFYNYNDESAGHQFDSKLSPTSVHQEICDRILVMLINEAADAFYLGIASRDDIDLAMTLGVNYPKGLLRWADEIGIQACVDKMDALFDIYHEERYRCSAGLRKMAASQLTFY